MCVEEVVWSQCSRRGSSVEVLVVLEWSCGRVV